MKHPIFVVAYNAPEFIPYQKALIDKFMPEFELFIINNQVPQFTTNIDKVCKELGVKYIDLMHQHHDSPNNSHSYAVNYAMENLLKEIKPEAFGVMDSDVFPICGFRHRESVSYLGDVYAAKQSRGPYEYFSPCLSIFHTYYLYPPNQACNFSDLDWRGYWFDNGDFKGDNGASTYFWIQKNQPSICWAKQELISVEHGGLNIVDEQCAQDIRNGPPGMHFEAWDRSFIHYYAGSNWPNWDSSFVARKKEILFNYLNRLLK